MLIRDNQRRPTLLIVLGLLIGAVSAMAAQAPAAAETFDALIPLGRHTSPEEIARAALYLASDDSAHMTSHTFVIDGGLSG